MNIGLDYDSWLIKRNKLSLNQIVNGSIRHKKRKIQRILTKIDCKNMHVKKCINLHPLKTVELLTSQGGGRQIACNFNLLSKGTCLNTPNPIT